MSSFSKKLRASTGKNEFMGLSYLPTELAFRCAIHFGGFSPEDRSLYQKFLGTEVHESDGISKTVTIWINGVCSCVSGAKGKIHIAEIAGQLRLCVPKDPRDRELCYLVQLPEKLASYLGITDAAATKVFGDLLKASPVLVEDVLTDHGIVQIPGLLDATSIDNLTQETSALTLANKAAPIGKDSELDVATVREAIGLSNHAITEVSDDATTFTPSQRTTNWTQRALPVQSLSPKISLACVQRIGLDMIPRWVWLANYMYVLRDVIWCHNVTNHF